MSARRRLLPLVLSASLAALAAAPATGVAAAPPKLDVMVVGAKRVLFGPRTVTARPALVTASGRRCLVRQATAIAALAAVGRLRHAPAVRLRDYGSCSASRARDSSGLFVAQVGRERNTGANGWVYKVGRRAGTAPAADVNGPFGTGRFPRTGARVLWFWCVMGADASCQRTLELSGPRRVARGVPLTLRVRGYDDQGRGVDVAGAAVRLGGSTGTTGPDGRVTLTAPAQGSATRALATAPGLVPSFPKRVALR